MAQTKPCTIPSNQHLVSGERKEGCHLIGDLKYQILAKLRTVPLLLQFSDTNAIWDMGLISDTNGKRKFNTIFLQCCRGGRTSQGMVSN